MMKEDGIRNSDFSSAFSKGSTFDFLGDAHGDEPIIRKMPVGKKMSLGQKFAEAANRQELTESSLSDMYDIVSGIVKEVTADRHLDTSRFLQRIARHDPYTYEHSWSVFTISLTLLQKGLSRGYFDMDHEEMVNFGLGALLHDLGKTNVSSDILNKPGKLNEREWLEMKMHPQFGIEIAHSQSKSGILPPLTKRIISNHHQRMDGKGYSASGVADPVCEYTQGVRIVSVADVYDALVSNRPYRYALMPGEAMEIIKSGSGSQFDPLFIPLLADSIIYYPPGSCLLFENGAVGSVLPTQYWTGKTPKLRIVAGLTSEGEGLVGSQFELSGGACPVSEDERTCSGRESPSVVIAGSTTEAFLERYGKKKDDLPGSFRQKEVVGLRDEMKANLRQTAPACS